MFLMDQFDETYIEYLAFELAESLTPLQQHRVLEVLLSTRNTREIFVQKLQEALEETLRGLLE